MRTKRLGPSGVAVGRATLYELVAERDGRRILVAYCQSRTRRGLYNALSNRLDHIQRVIGTKAIDWADRARDGATMGAWRVWWTGRTERDARASGTLPYIGDE